MTSSTRAGMHRYAVLRQLCEIALAPDLSQHITDALAKKWHNDGVVPAMPEMVRSLDSSSTQKVFESKDPVAAPDVRAF